MIYRITRSEYEKVMYCCKELTETYLRRREELVGVMEATSSYWKGNAADTLRKEFKSYLETGEYDKIIREYRRIAEGMEEYLPEIRRQMDIQDQMSFIISGAYKPEPEELYLDVTIQEEMLNELKEIDCRVKQVYNDAIAGMSGIDDIIDLSNDRRFLCEKQKVLSEMIKKYNENAIENTKKIKQIDGSMIRLFSYKLEDVIEETKKTRVKGLSLDIKFIDEITALYNDLTKDEIEAIRLVNERIKRLPFCHTYEERIRMIKEILSSNMKHELSSLYAAYRYSSKDYNTIMNNIILYIQGPRYYPVNDWIDRINDAEEVELDMDIFSVRNDVNRTMRLLYDEQIFFLDEYLTLSENGVMGTDKEIQKLHEMDKFFVAIVKNIDAIEEDIISGIEFYDAIEKELIGFESIILEMKEKEIVRKGTVMDLPIGTKGIRKPFEEKECFTDFSYNSTRMINYHKVYTDERGFLRVPVEGFREDAYLVAMGTYYTGDMYTVGEVFWIKYDNGYSMLCVTGDVKADSNTDSVNQYAIETEHDIDEANIIEFIIERNASGNAAAYTYGSVDKVEEWENMQGGIEMIIKLDIDIDYMEDYR